MISLSISDPFVSFGLIPDDLANCDAVSHVKNFFLVSQSPNDLADVFLT